MYPSHDMNPLAIEQMRRERLEADIEHVDRGTNIGVQLGVTAVAILLTVAIVI